MNKEFIPYEEALALKELGFDEMYFGQYFVFEGESEPILCYDEDQYHIVKDNPNVKIETILSPTYSQAFRWFREKHSLFHVITIADLGKYETGDPDFQCAIYSKDPVVITNIDTCNTYEEAELECLRKLIEIVNQNKDG